MAAAAILALNIALQAGSWALARSGHMEPSDSIRLALWGGVGFYVAALALVVTRMHRFGVRPAWVRPGTRDGLSLGLAAGIGGGIVVAGLGWLVSHVFTGDPTIEIMVSELTPLRVVLTVGLAVVAAPVVEELFFRGLVLEALRYKGTRTAAIVSSVLFALFHLRPGIVYFTVVGIVLAAIYLRFGLRASIAAHAGFNGVLTLLAVLTVIAPGQRVVLDGVTLRTPSSAWHVVTDVQGQDLGPLPPGFTVDMEARGPSASALGVGHLDVPPGEQVDPEAFVAALGSAGTTVAEGAAVVPGSAKVEQLPAGRAVRVSRMVASHALDIVMLPIGDRLWTFSFSAGGSHRAAGDFDQILQSIRPSDRGSGSG